MLTSPQSIINCSFQMCQRGKGLLERLEREQRKRGEEGREREDASYGAEPAGPRLGSAAGARPRSQRGLGGSALSAALPGNPAQAATDVVSFQSSNSSPGLRKQCRRACLGFVGLGDDSAPLS